MPLLSLLQLRQGFAHMFFPVLCEGCRRPLIDGEQVLCLSCCLEVPETGYHSRHDNDTEQRFSGRFPFVRATSWAWFTADGLLQHLVHALKYHNRPEIGTWLGTRLGEQLMAAGWAHDTHMVIPVPLHPTRQATRGYNQSSIIAASLAAAMQLPTGNDHLHRIRKTDSQTQKTRTERAENMAGAFEVRDAAHIAGRHILLIDDVLTTGATLEACALALLTVPGVKISIATIGIAVS